MPKQDYMIRTLELTQLQNVDESYLKLTSSAVIPIRDGTVRIEARGTSSGLDASGFPGSTIKLGMTGGYLTWLYSSKMEIRAGAYFMGFDSDSQTGTDPARSLTWVAPLARIDYLLSRSITVTAGTAPSIGEALQRDAIQTSPYLMDEPRLLPTLTSIDASVGIIVQVRLCVGLGESWMAGSAIPTLLLPACESKPGLFKGIPSPSI